jgi:hypothetical protein
MPTTKRRTPQEAARAREEAAATAHWTPEQRAALKTPAVEHSTPKEAVAEVKTPAERRYIPLGELTPVECDVPGFEGVVLFYDLEARWDAVYGRVKDSDGLAGLRRTMVLCPRIEWNWIDPLTEEPVPPSVAPDLDSYSISATRGLPVTLWATSSGLNKALDAALKN